MVRRRTQSRSRSPRSGRSNRFTRTTSRSRSRSRSRVGQAVQMVLDNIENVVGAVDAVRQFGNARQQSETRDVDMSPRRAPKVRTTKFRGKFKKGSKKIANTLKTYLTQGFVDTEEVNGQITDPNCVYLSHSACDADRHLTLVLKCIFRKLLKLGINWSAPSADDEFPIEQSSGQANAIRIELVLQNMRTGSISKIENTSVAGGNFNTIAKMAAASNWAVALRKWMGGHFLETDDPNMLMPIYFRLYELDFAPLGQNFRLCAEIDLRCATVHVKVKSDMKIQNRSVSATGSADAEDVNNNPLMGYKYDFKVGTPITRNDGAYLLSTVSGNSGVNLIRGAQLPQSYREPPLPKVFLKCNKAAKIKIQPGDIKYGSITFYKKMKVLDYLQKLGFYYSPYNADPAVWRNLRPVGPCQMFALEDVINVNANELIRVAYEVNRETSMFITMKNIVPSIGTFIQSTYNNNPV